MKVGVPKEIKQDEYRVAITPAGVREMVEHGHEVYVETTAGEEAQSRTPSSRPRARRSCPTPPRSSRRRR